MSYTLIGSIRSPFVRTCRMFMTAQELPFDFHILNFVDSAKDAEALSKESPINKVPVLLSGKQKIYDSRVIINHLIARHNLKTLTLDEENLISSIYAAMDSGVILFLMRQDKFDIQGPGFFLSRQRHRIPDNLSYITPRAAQLDPAKDWYYPAMALYSALYWLRARDLTDLKDHPKLIQFLERFKDCTGVQETTFSL